MSEAVAMYECLQQKTGHAGAGQVKENDALATIQSQGLSWKDYVHVALSKQFIPSSPRVPREKLAHLVKTEIKEHNLAVLCASEGSGTTSLSFEVALDWRVNGRDVRYISLQDVPSHEIGALLGFIQETLTLLHLVSRDVLVIIDDIASIAEEDVKNAARQLRLIQQHQPVLLLLRPRADLLKEALSVSYAFDARQLAVRYDEAQAWGASQQESQLFYSHTKGIVSVAEAYWKDLTQEKLGQDNYSVICDSMMKKALLEAPMKEEFDLRAALILLQRGSLETLLTIGLTHVEELMDSSAAECLIFGINEQAHTFEIAGIERRPNKQLIRCIAKESPHLFSRICNFLFEHQAYERLVSIITACPHLEIVETLFKAVPLELLEIGGPTFILSVLSQKQDEFAQELKGFAACTPVVLSEYLDATQHPHNISLLQSYQECDDFLYQYAQHISALSLFYKRGNFGKCSAYLNHCKDFTLQQTARRNGFHSSFHDEETNGAQTSFQTEILKQQASHIVVLNALLRGSLAEAQEALIYQKNKKQSSMSAAWNTIDVYLVQALAGKPLTQEICLQAAKALDYFKTQANKESLCYARVCISFANLLCGKGVHKEWLEAAKQFAQEYCHDFVLNLINLLIALYWSLKGDGQTASLEVLRFARLCKKKNFGIIGQLSSLLMQSVLAATGADSGAYLCPKQPKTALLDIEKCFWWHEMKCTEIFDVVNLEAEQIEAGMSALNHIEPTPLRSALVLPLYRGSSASSTTFQKYCPSRWREAFQQVAGDTTRATSLKVVCGVHDQEQNCATCATLPAQVLSIHLLGNTAGAGTQMQRTVLNKARKQSRTLLYLLALKPAHVLSREEAAQLLWPSAASDVVQARLYTVLSGLRKALKELGMDDALICSDSTIALNPGRVRIDLDFFLQKLALILSQNTTYSKRCALMHEAIAQYKEGVFIRISKGQQSVFIQAHEEVERRFVDSLVVSARACEAQAYRSDALEFASLAWRLAPLREDVVEVYLRALSLNGRYDESEQYYQAYASKILAEKGSLPHLELKDVLVSGPTHTLSKPERPLRVNCVIES